MRSNYLACAISCSVVAVLFRVSMPAEASVVTYPAPDSAAASAVFSVTADGQAVHVYRIIEAARAGRDQAPRADVAAFSFSDTVAVAVRVARPFGRVDVRPASLRIRPAVSGDTIRFTLRRQAYVSIELDGDTKRPLMLFADTLETDTPSAADTNVYYFAGDSIHRIGDLSISGVQGKTVYLAGGAVVVGTISVISCRSVTIRGRGMLLGGGGVPLWVYDCDSVTVDGPIIINESDSSALQCIRMRDSRVRNCKVIATRRDGVDLSNCRRTVLEKSFVCSVDDAVSLKGNYDWGFDDSTLADTVRSCVVWNAGCGAGLEVGREMMTPCVRHCLFRDVDIIHNEASDPPFDLYFTTAAISIHDGGPTNAHGYVSDIRYENIRIEDCRQPYLFDFTVPSMNPYNNPANPYERQIANIYLKDVAVTGGAFPPSNMAGMNSAHGVRDVTFDGLSVYGRPVLSAGELKLQMNAHVSGVVFMAGGGATTPPAAPDSLRATGLAGQGSVLLRWRDRSDNETSFSVELARAGDSAFSHAVSLAAGCTTWTATGLLYASRYRFRVQACNAAGCSGWSDTATVSTDSGAAAPADFLKRWRFDNNGDEDNGGAAAQILGGAAFTADAHVGAGALALDSLGAHADLGTVALGDAFTIAFWEKQCAAGSTRQVLVANCPWATVTDGLILSLVASDATARANCLVLRSGNGADTALARSDAMAFAIGRWYHLALSVNRPAGRARIFVDGMDVTSLDAATPGLRPDTTVLVGTSYSGWGFKGLIDDLRIYRRALAQDEVAALASMRADLVPLARAPLGGARTPRAPRSVVRMGGRALPAARAGVVWFDSRGRLVRGDRPRAGVYFSRPPARPMNPAPAAAR